MMDTSVLLLQLSDGLFHSGSSLGEALGVSRAAVWKAVNRLSEYGLDVESVKGKGYRVCGGLDLLTYDKVMQHIDTLNQQKLSMELMLEVDSTNNRLMLKDGLLSEYEVCVSELQHSGKGRRGKIWVSPFGKNVCLSMAFDLSGGSNALNGLSLVVGLVVVRVLRKLGQQDVMLKWPNDIWIGSKKVAGVLVELQGEATTGWRIVAGVGINVKMGNSDRVDIDQPWVSLCESLSCNRSEVAGLLVNGLIDAFSEFKEKGFEAFRSEWAEYDFLKGKNVLLNGGAVEGYALGVDSQGALLVDTVCGVKAVNAGEVSVRPK